MNSAALREIQMAEKVVYSGYPKIDIVYDAVTQPFFWHIVKEALDDLNAIDVGKDLLDGIYDANPTYRGRDEKGFERGAHVAIFPPYEILTVIKRKFSHFKKNKGSDDLWQGCSIAHSSVDWKTAENGEGSVSRVYFTNSRFRLKSGLVNPAHVALGHELIHALHGLLGIKKNTTDEEENFTVGLGAYKNEPITENAIRKQSGLALRESY